jgi:acetyl-CoA carboxylase carboxyltransferase component
VSATKFEELYKHYAHNVVVARYAGLDGEVVGVAVECQECQEVLLDYDNEKEGDDENN